MNPRYGPAPRVIAMTIRSAKGHLEQIRQLFFAGKYIEARDLCAQHVLGREDSYGTHLPMADLLIDMKHGGAPADYRRLLDLDEGVAQVEYSIEGVWFRREVLASNPDNMVAMHLTSGKPGQLSFNLGLSGGDLPFKVHAGTGTRSSSPATPGRTNTATARPAWSSKAWLRVLNAGGTVSEHGDHLTLEAADAATLLVTANTTYRGHDPEALCREQMEAAAGKSYHELRKAHVSDHRASVSPCGHQLGRD